MDNFEKIIFLLLTKEQFEVSIYDSEFTSLFDSFAESDQQRIVKLSQEIRRISGNINRNPNTSPSIPYNKIETIEEYHENVEPVSSIILKVADDFGISLVKEPDEKFKESVIAVFGKEYYDRLFGGG